MVENNFLVDMMVFQKLPNTDRVRNQVLHDFEEAIKKIPADCTHFEVHYKVFGVRQV
jgi:hypothetical protein